MPAEDGSVFILLPVQKGADCAAPHKNIFVKVERENKMSKITRRNFLKVSGVAAAAAALTACGLHRKLRRFRRCIL
jgi:D-methionine transport system substrate-binding protein